MNQGFESGPARADETLQAIAVLDAVFLHGRGRGGSIAERYAPLFAADARVFVTRQAGKVIAVVVSRPFVFRDGSTAHPACMLGFVATLPAFRGAGHASQLVKLATDAARQEGRVFCVLWAQAQSFYRRLGWRAGDSGMRGEAPALVNDAPPPRESGVADVQALARRAGSLPVARTAAWYGVIPVSTDQIRCFVAGPSEAPDAYALVGDTARTRFVYELGGAEAVMRELLTGLRGDRRALVVNASANDAVHRLPGAPQDLHWHTQQLAMWLPLTPALEDIADRGWHIPWFDRI